MAVGQPAGLNLIRHGLAPAADAVDAAHPCPKTEADGARLEKLHLFPVGFENDLLFKL